MNPYRSSKSPSKRLLSALAITLIATTARADESNWQWHGVLTQGLIYSSDNNFYGNSDDDVSWKFTEINLNASARLMPNLRAAGQVLYRHAGEQTEGGDIDYLFVDYQAFRTSNFYGDLRAGRVKIPFGLYNETRDIAFTRPSIYLPQSSYPDIARDLHISADGLFASAELLTDAGQWTAELAAGEPRIDQRTVRSLFGFIPGDISDVDAHNSLAARVMLQSNDGKWLTAISAVDVNFDYRIMSSIDTGVKFKYWLASLQYNLDQWTFTGEYGQMNAQLKTDALTENLYPRSYHLQATRRFSSLWSAYTRWDNLYWDRHDPGGDGWAELTGEEKYRNYSHDYTLGVRFDIRNDMMISAEYHYIEGIAWLSRFDNPNFADAAKYWDMLALEFSYRF